ncbi:MAG: SDR family oxidoreductase [Granulosicoccus sp.]|nr:SDR family oxidoreductase [Granulosicoccus sp.]
MSTDPLTPGYSRVQFDLTGQVAVVTGGSGILGRCFCAALADHGASVAVVDMQQAAAEEYATELSETFGVTARGFYLDVSETDSIEPVVNDIEQALGPVTILLNNAASKGRSLESFFCPTEDYSPATWREIMAVNLDGAFFVAQAVGRRMASRGAGSIVQTASVYGIVGPDQRIYDGSEYMGMRINTPAVYSVSKAGIVGMTKYLATYWANRGVRVNTLTPGGVSSGQNSTFTDQYSHRVPLGRMAAAEDMTGAMIFLASDASRYVTGQNVIVDGGLSAW